jgi:rhamnose utilization protein RhaD (predicted bifunctional aldolase and dehydrogenase)/NAD(P)-dependent dehydrogenase (short-subunit alcohol dehydrogenase family)
VKNRWDATEAAKFVGDLAQRVYTSRLLGADSSLVLHGGGNTSVKSSVTTLFGASEEVLYVKGSGWDLETIEAPGFAPCRMRHLLQLADLEELSDAQMAVELKKSLTDPNGPMPSVEAIMHAIIPAKFVDHTHADALLALTNAPGGELHVREIYGSRVIILPYVMPGFKLARQCAEQFFALSGPATEGMLLMSHGLFTFGATAKEAYERMIDLVTLAEEYLTRHGAHRAGVSKRGALGKCKSTGPIDRIEVARLRRAISAAAGAPMILKVNPDEEALAFASRPDIEKITQQGPATPDHVIRTKRLPLIGRDVDAFVTAYQCYFEKYSDTSLTMLDPAPRVVLDLEFGLCTAGKTAKDAGIVEDIYLHTMRIISQATELGGWQALDARDIFEVEYWDLEQAKLRKSGKLPMFTGEVALVTGAASGIGRACVLSLLERGAAVVGLDLSSDITTLHRRKDFHGIACDVTREEQIELALTEAVQTYGGIDLLILNAGIFPPSRPVAELDMTMWRKVMAINLDANLHLLRTCYPLLRLAPRHGRVVVIGSKNVAAPGPGAAAYSASKAAVNQLARVAALEWGSEGIRINSIHPNMVFDTALWTAEALASRASHYGLSIEHYKTNNVLKVPVNSRDVAELAAEMCGPLFAKTTGAQIPVDGGNDRVI